MGKHTAHGTDKVCVVVVVVVVVVDCPFTNAPCFVSSPGGMKRVRKRKRQRAKAALVCASTTPNRTKPNRV